MMPQNVAQPYTIYDSVGVSCGLDDYGRIPPGWFNSFSAMGQAGDIHFFDMRNKSDTGMPYNNQDSRDLMAYGFYLRQISVAFIAPATAEFVNNGYAESMTSQYVWSTIEAQNSPIWSSELPQHCGIELRINTDIHLKANVAMIGAAAGGVGGGFGSAMNNSTYPSGISYVPNIAQNTFSNGVPQVANSWTFPVKIGVPRKAAVSVVLKPSEWARNLLQTITGPGAGQFVNTNDTPIPQWHYNLYTIRVALHGIRLLQQRGEYHAG